MLFCIQSRFVKDAVQTSFPSESAPVGMGTQHITRKSVSIEKYLFQVSVCRDLRFCFVAECIQYSLHAILECVAVRFVLYTYSH